MAAPSQMFEHALDYLKGWHDITSLDFEAKLSSNVTIDPVYGGRVVHVNSEGEFEMGVSGTQMPIFLIQGSDSFDVSNEGGGNWYATLPAGTMSGLVATGGYELETTEYNKNRTYSPNDLLCADADNTTAADGGVLDNQDDADAVLGIPWGGSTDQAICGVVSRGTYKNGHNQDVLAFWPVYLPGAS